MNKHHFFAFSRGPSGFWFRVWGYGLHIMLRAQHRPLFSERYGYVKPLYIGPLRLMALQPERASRGRGES